MKALRHDCGFRWQLPSWSQTTVHQFRRDSTTGNLLGNTGVDDRHDLAREPIDQLCAVSVGGCVKPVQLSIVPDRHSHEVFLVAMNSQSKPGPCDPA